MESTNSPTSLALEYGLRVVRRRAWLIVMFLAVTTVAAFGFSATRTKEYTATAALLFKDESVAQQASGDPIISNNDPQGTRNTNLLLVQLSNGVAQRTAAQLRAGLTANDVMSAVTASDQDQSNIVTVSATWPNPVLAARIANTFANAFIEEKLTSDQATIQSAIALINQQYSALSPAQQAGARGQSLTDHLESLKVLKVLQANEQLYQAATVPTSPSSPKTLRNTIVGALLGLLLGLGLAVLLDRMDRTLREPEDVEASLKLPILAFVPHARDVRGPKRGRALSLGYEPFLMLRAHLRYFNVDRELRSLLVTSGAPSEGKTTVSSNLAVAAASMGTKTLLIEADLRRPTVAKQLGMAPSAGLADVLAGIGSLEETIQRVDVSAEADGSVPSRIVDVLVAGGIPPNPSELLESQAMNDLLAWARADYELVVIDTSPLSVVADAIPLVKQVDGVIVVSRLGVSTRDSSQRLRERLSTLSAPTLGVVVNDIRLRGDGYDGYGYASYDPGSSPDTKIEESPSPIDPAINDPVPLTDTKVSEPRRGSVGSSRPGVKGDARGGADNATEARLNGAPAETDTSVT